MWSFYWCGCIPLSKRNLCCTGQRFNSTPFQNTISHWKFHHWFQNYGNVRLWVSNFTHSQKVKLCFACVSHTPRNGIIWRYLFGITVGCQLPRRQHRTPEQASELGSQLILTPTYNTCTGQTATALCQTHPSGEDWQSVGMTLFQLV